MYEIGGSFSGVIRLFSGHALGRVAIWLLLHCMKLAHILAPQNVANGAGLMPRNPARRETDVH
jgi:hypothetical protein